MYKAQSMKLSENPVVTQHSSTVELEETKKAIKPHLSIWHILKGKSVSHAAPLTIQKLVKSAYHRRWLVTTSVMFGGINFFGF